MRLHLIRLTAASALAVAAVLASSAVAAADSDFRDLPGYHELPGHDFHPGDQDGRQWQPYVTAAPLPLNLPLLFIPALAEWSYGPRLLPATGSGSTVPPFFRAVDQ